MTRNGENSKRLEGNIDPMRSKLVPYVTVDGVRTLRDSQLARLFELAKEDDVLEPALYTEDLETMTAQKFVEFYKKPGLMLCFVYFDRKLAGWVWIDDFGRRTARVHFCTLKWLTREQQTVRCAREIMWQLLSLTDKNGATLNVLRGETPGYNKLAVRFLRRVGMKVVGEIPMAAHRFATGVSYPMVYSFITKDILEEHMIVVSSEPTKAAKFDMAVSSDRL